jgi:hypothetical protein
VVQHSVKKTIMQSIQSEDVLETNEELMTQDNGRSPGYLRGLAPQSTPSAPPDTTFLNQPTISEVDSKDVGGYDSLSKVMLVHL